MTNPTPTLTIWTQPINELTDQFLRIICETKTETVQIKCREIYRQNAVYFINHLDIIGGWKLEKKQKGKQRISSTREGIITDMIYTYTLTKK